MARDEVTLENNWERKAGECEIRNEEEKKGWEEGNERLKNLKKFWQTD